MYGFVAPSPSRFRHAAPSSEHNLKAQAPTRTDVWQTQLFLLHDVDDKSAYHSAYALRAQELRATVFSPGPFQLKFLWVCPRDHVVAQYHSCLMFLSTTMTATGNTSQTTSSLYFGGAATSTGEKRTPPTTGRDPVALKHRRPGIDPSWTNHGEQGML